MKIEWWMIDGGVGLILLVAAVLGAAKGIGDTVLRILGFIGGLVLAVFFSGRVSEFLAGTKLHDVLYLHIYQIIRPGAEDALEQSVGTQSDAVTSVVGHGPDSYGSLLPKSLSGLATTLEDKAAEVATERLTSIAMSVLSFALIVLAVWLVVLIIRLIFKSGKKNVFVIGFFDRLLGFILGIIRGTLISCVAIAALIPVTTLIAPDKVAEMLEALHSTYVSGIIYDVNPIMLLINHFILG